MVMIMAMFETILMTNNVCTPRVEPLFPGIKIYSRPDWMVRRKRGNAETLETALARVPGKLHGSGRCDGGLGLCTERTAGCTVAALNVVISVPVAVAAFLRQPHASASQGCPVG